MKNFIGDNELTSKEDWDDSWSKILLRTINDNDSILGKDGAFLRSTEKYLLINSGANILELGGACSSYLCSLAKYRKANASVIDYSHIGLNKTKILFEMNGQKINLYEGDFFEYDFKEEKFDLVVHWGLIEHFKDPSQIFKLCSSLLKKSGSMIFTMPNMEAWGASFWEKYDAKDFEGHIYHTDTLINELSKIFGFINFTSKLDRDKFKDNIPANFINRGFIFTIE